MATSGQSYCPPVGRSNWPLTLRTVTPCRRSSTVSIESRPAWRKGSTVETAYDGFAAEYNADNERNLLSAYYERPAMLDLVGNATGRDVLDIGCGAGPLAERLAQGGARVSGFDSSTHMIEIARQRLGEDVDLQVADLAEPLPYEDDSFDVA